MTFPNDRIDINPEFWGPHFWGMLHAMADGAPENPTEDERKAYLSVIEALPYILPCSKCRKNLQKNFKDGFKPSYNNQQELVFSLHNLHNAVNKDLNKPEKTLDCCQKSYVPEVSVAFWTLVFTLMLIVLSIVLISHFGGKCNISKCQKIAE